MYNFSVPCKCFTNKLLTKKLTKKQLCMYSVEFQKYVRTLIKSWNWNYIQQDN